MNLPRYPIIASEMLWALRHWNNDVNRALRWIDRAKDLKRDGHNNIARLARLEARSCAVDARVYWRRFISAYVAEKQRRVQ